MQSVFGKPLYPRNPGTAPWLRMKSSAIRVQLEGRHSRANVLGQLGQRSADQPVVLTEQLDLFRRFKVYHLAFERLSGSALDPSGLHQAVVVTQEQVAFNLLESVKNNAHQDQQRRPAIEQRELIVDSDNHGKSG